MKQNLYLMIFLLFGWGLIACKKTVYINDEGNLVPRTVETDPAIPAISVNNARFHAETFGNPANKMLVILHGGPGSDYRYLLNCKSFADQGYFVVFYDQRGSGLSARYSKDSYSIQVMLDDLAGVIAHYRSSPNQKVFLLGHSWGAILAAAFINAHASESVITGAVLCEPGGLKWQDIKDYVSRSRDFRFTSEALNDAAYLDQFITGNIRQQAILDYKLSLLSVADGNPGNPTGDEATVPFWRYGAVVNKALFDLGERDKPDFTTHLSAYSTPVLFVYSENNRAYGVDYATRISTAFPHVQLARIAGAGHDFPAFPAGWANFFPIAVNYLNAF